MSAALSCKTKPREGVLEGGLEGVLEALPPPLGWWPAPIRVWVVLGLLLAEQRRDSEDMISTAESARFSG